MLNATYAAVTGASCNVAVGDQEVLDVDFTFASTSQGTLAVLTPSMDTLVFDVAVAGNVLTISGTAANGTETSTVGSGSQLTFSPSPERLLGTLIVTTVDGPDMCMFELDIDGTPGMSGGGSFTVGGQVSGLEGSVTLRLNGTQDLTLSSDGPFTFPDALSDGSTYTVTAAAAPAGQFCTITGGTGSSSGSDVTDVLVVCERSEESFDFQTSLPDDIDLVGILRIDAQHPGYAPGGTVEFSSGGILAYRFVATQFEQSEVIDSELAGTVPPTLMSVTFSSTDFPTVSGWDVLCSNVGSGLPTASLSTFQNPTNDGADVWMGTLFTENVVPSRGQLSRRPDFLAYDFDASLSDGIEVLGQVVIDTRSDDYVPGGIMEFSTGEIQSFRFRASDNTLVDFIDSETPGISQNQMVQIQFATTAFPVLDSWDIDCDNTGTGFPPASFVTRDDPSSDGFEEWSGVDLVGFATPATGTWGPRPKFARYTYTTVLPDTGLIVVGEIFVDTQGPNYTTDGVLVFDLGDIESYRFAATDNIDFEIIDSNEISTPSPLVFEIVFNIQRFPDVSSWEMSCTNQSAPLISFSTARNPGFGGLDEWTGNLFSGMAAPSNGEWMLAE